VLLEGAVVCATIVNVNREPAHGDQEAKATVLFCHTQGCLEIRESLGVVGLGALACGWVVWYFGRFAVLVLRASAAEEGALA